VGLRVQFSLKTDIGYPKISLDNLGVGYRGPEVLAYEIKPKFIGLLVQSLVEFSASCWLGALEPDVLRPYQHVLQRGGTPLPHHAVDPSPNFITFEVKVLSSHLPAPDATNCTVDVLRTGLTMLQLKRSGANVARVIRKIHSLYSSFFMVTLVV